MASPNVSWVKGDVGFLMIVSPKYGVKLCRVDADRLKEVSPHRWAVCSAKGRAVYAHTVIHKNGGRKRHTMHSFLFPDCPEGLVRDHKNGDGFDNRNSNIRIVTQAHNALNRRKRKHPPGVAACKDRFRAYLTIGFFDTEEEAHEAWKKAYATIHGGLPECVS